MIVKDKKPKIGDIVQILCLPGNEGWSNCLMIVHEVKSWGVSCYMKVPFQQGHAWLRLKFDECVVVGCYGIVDVDVCGGAAMLKAPIDAKSTN